MHKYFFMSYFAAQGQLWTFYDRRQPHAPDVNQSLLSAKYEVRVTGSYVRRLAPKARPSTLGEFELGAFWFWVNVQYNCADLPNSRDTDIFKFVTDYFLFQ